MVLTVERLPTAEDRVRVLVETVPAILTTTAVLPPVPYAGLLRLADAILAASHTTVVPPTPLEVPSVPGAAAASRGVPSPTEAVPPVQRTLTIDEGARAGAPLAFPQLVRDARASTLDASATNALPDAILAVVLTILPVAIPCQMLRTIPGPAPRNAATRVRKTAVRAVTPSEAARDHEIASGVPEIHHVVDVLPLPTTGVSSTTTLANDGARAVPST